LQGSSCIHELSSSIAIDFTRLFYSTNAFIDESEKISGQHCVGLRPTLLSQVHGESLTLELNHGKAKAFLDSFHSKRVTSLAESLENENWVQMEMPPEIQALVDQIVGEALIPMTNATSTTSGNKCVDVSADSDV
jgi:hypothetical protein